MKSLNTLLLAGSAAAAVVGIGLAASAFGSTLTPNQLGTPDDGMICRSGYTGALVGKAFKCSKTLDVRVNLVCDKPKFQKYSVRTGERDLCSRDGVNIPISGAFTAALGQDYVRAVVDTAAVTTETANQNAAEASALGLTTNDVETVAAEPVLDIDGGGGGKDKADVTLTHYTFAIKTGPLASVR